MIADKSEREAAKLRLKELVAIRVQCQREMAPLGEIYPSEPAASIARERNKAAVREAAILRAKLDY